MKRILLVVALAAGLNVMYAQQNFTDENSPVPRFEIEVDPIAFALNGYSLHLVYVRKHVSFDLGGYGIEQPEGFTGNKRFSTYSQGFGTKLNFLLNEKQTFYAGIGGGYLNNRIRHKELSREQTLKSAGVGVHTGYRFFMFKKGSFKNLYLAPWVSLNYNIDLNEVDFGAYEYKTKKWSVFPTVHVGYRFYGK